VTGFEISSKRPVVAFERRLVAIDVDRQFAMPTLDPIEALAVDDDGGLWVQQRSQLSRVGKERLERIRSTGPAARVYNSGHRLFLEAETQGQATRLTLRTADDRATLPPFHVEGGLPVALSLNPLGIAAVIGDSLLTWSSGSKTVATLRKDPGLQSARDAVLIGPSRAVVALANTLLLITDRGATVLAFLKARVRWTDGALYVLDEQWGLIWRLTGLEHVGTAGADAAHAAALVGRRGQSAAETDPGFLEAARLVGCEGARALAKGRQPEPLP
jgi:hypothetical protein